MAPGHGSPDTQGDALSRAWKGVGRAVPEDGHLREVFENQGRYRAQWQEVAHHRRETVRRPQDPRKARAAGAGGFRRRTAQRGGWGQGPGSPGKTCTLLWLRRSRCCSSEHGPVSLGHSGCCSLVPAGGEGPY